ncbi:hypothetical protein FDP22_00975 [Paroceanicella profunda]|uniref:DUF4258 domain-containing protein n=1 Tax=Paroceanicella profunda TaxID=2579971 RepID=A0A5B8FVH6_9RHOB|nr:hypothetical protein [Paroceanicella profunda]QDL90489.1 hypothetical protein FDP22_00975 [Paroceanicella profunda]
MKRNFLPIAAVVSVMAAAPVLAQTYGTGTPQGNVVPPSSTVVTPPANTAVTPMGTTVTRMGQARAPGMVHDERDLTQHIGRAQFSDQLRTEDQVARVVKEAYGSNVHHGHSLSEATLQQIRPGNLMPTSVREQAVPSRLSGKLPNSQPGSRWARVGSNLVEIGSDGRILVTVYDIVPSA